MAFNLLTSITRRCASSFFNRRPAEQLWKSVFSVSSAGRKKGRGRGARSRDLNRGQRIGDGPIRALLPGFHTDALREMKPSTAPFQVQYLPPDPDRQERILEKQRDVRRKKAMRLHPLLRGYSGDTLQGRKLGWPMVDAASPIADQSDPLAIDAKEQLSQFETVCVWMKRRRLMTPVGRKMEVVALMAVGNGNGLGGYGVGIDNEPRGAVRKGTSLAVKRLQYVERLDNRTVYQDFFAECQGVNMFGQRMAEGFGLRCHRAIKLLCQLVGIKDLRVKVMGNTKNYKNITKAFFTALANQETHQQLAERKRLLVVEFRRERNYLPVVVASPQHAPCREEEELKPDEVFDVDELYGEGRYPRCKPRAVPFYEYLDSWKRKLHKEHPFRNMESVKMRLLADGVVSDFSEQAQERTAKEWHEQVMVGQRLLPIGLGLTDVFMREDWNPIEKKKK